MFYNHLFSLLVISVIICFYNLMLVFNILIASLGLLKNTKVIISFSLAKSYRNSYLTTYNYRSFLSIDESYKGILLS